MADITIKELAQLCGVAVSTVSRAMNNRADVSPETRARILEAAEKYGYVPNASARSLKIADTRSVAVIVQGEASPLLLQLHGLLERALAEAGYGLMLAHVPQSSAHARTVARIVTDRKFSGVIFLGRYGDRTRGDGPQLSRSLAEIGVPMVFSTTADFSGAASRHSSVSVDDRAGGYDLTRHLLDLGHRRIACVGVGQPDDVHYAWALRVAGHRQALAEAGASLGPGLELPSTLPHALYTMENGYESMRARLAQGEVDFTAVLCTCDAVAVGVTRALGEAGLRVPQDCSVTGFDGLDVARFYSPSITTIAQPLDDIANATARVLLSAIEHPGKAVEQVWIRGELLERESSGPVR